MKNIFVIVAPDYTEEEVKGILKRDGYIDNFVFGSKFEKNKRDTWKKIMLDCDEIWIYGQTNRTFAEEKWQHSFAKKEGLDIWNMG